MRRHPTRRQFLAGGVASGAALVRPVARETAVRFGFVGVGARGTGLLRTLLSLPDTQVPAVCDIVAERAEAAAALVERARGRRPEVYARGERDFERLCERDDLDAVLTATPWEWHAPVMLAAMRAGKAGLTEVPACLTLAEAQALVRTSEATSRACMMLENVCYFEEVLAILRMAREGLFGDLLNFGAGYQHDVRFLCFTEDGRLTWRGRHFATRNGNQYPTHAIGPVAWWAGIGRGDRIVSLSSVSTASLGLRAYATQRFGASHPLAKRTYAQGDVNTTVLRTALGRTITLSFDCCTPRPYDLIFRAQGTAGIVEAGAGRAYFAGRSPAPDAWEPLAPLVAKHTHPTWARLREAALRDGGHGGCDYVMLHEVVEALRAGTPLPQDVYDAVTWSAIVPLSADSVRRGGAVVPFPDFSGGRWKSRPPVE